MMEGGCSIDFIGMDESYVIGMPNVYARGILFGTMFMELGDSTTIRCEKSDLVCELDFKVKVILFLILIKRKGILWRIL